ncbi:heparinase II/III family protein [Kocuria rosea]|uniref:heparinase II/III domain-containing protein n=1 Tax=Kocuria rosea TaxID=1275 RepID=UPI000F6ED965|nr:heparinase II/III family protein [Kocuria rosea]VEI50383.1 Uncharacterized protein conserved in bacteria [Kocuria rosea]
MLEHVKNAIDSFVPVVRSSTAGPRAQRFLNEGLIAHPVLGEIPYDDGSCWKRELPRSLGRYLHGFLFFADWYESLLPTSEKALEAATDAMMTWAVANPTPPGSAEMAFHDETTAQRLLQICHFLDGWGHRLAPEPAAVLAETARMTADLLLEAHFYAGRNNHGMFQDLALLRFAVAGPNVRVKEEDALRQRCADTGTERLYAYLTGAFTSDGVHVENSPGYHLMVSRYLRDLLPVFRAVDVDKAAALEETYRGAERFATHGLLPNGYLVPVSDTKVEQVRSTGHRSTFTGPEYQYAVTQGANGRVPAERSAVFEEAGYAFHRSSWGNPEADYLMFKAAYRSNYHHHADDLSLLFYTSGQLVLTEAGPYGYDYTDPLTRYAFSQYAHNTVVVDGRSQPRVDPEPAGVSLRDLGASDGILLGVEACNSRTPGTVHSRRVTVAEDEASTSVQVHDRVEHEDGDGHSYEVLWHLGHGVRPLLHGHGVELFLGEQKVLELTWSASAPTSARLLTPKNVGPPRAHRFPAFGTVEDGLVIAVTVEGRHLDLVTTIRSGDFLYKDWGIGAVDTCWSQAQEEVPITYLLERVDGASELVVAFSAMAPRGSFTYNYKSTLDKVKAHRLYLLDNFGDQGAYYYCDHRDLRIYRSVQRLLARIIRELGVHLADVTLVGSSKGGTAALIHGSSLGAGRIVVGAPQVRIGSFLRDPHPNVMEFMAGGRTNDDIAWLDRIVNNHVRKIRPQTSIELLIGTRDHHFRSHLPRLMDVLSEAGHTNVTVKPMEGLTHADIGRPFAKFLADRFTRLTPGEDPPSELKVHANVTGRSIRVVAEGVLASDYCAFYLYKGHEVVHKTAYTRCLGRTSFHELETGAYRVRMFKKSTTESAPATASSTTVMVGI